MVKTSIYLPTNLHRKAKVLAASKGKDLNDVFTIAVKLLLKIVEAKRIPDDLGYMLQTLDKELLKEIEELVR